MSAPRPQESSSWKSITEIQPEGLQILGQEMIKVYTTSGSKEQSPKDFQLNENKNIFLQAAAKTILRNS